MQYPHTVLIMFQFPMGILENTCYNHKNADGVTFYYQFQQRVDKIWGYNAACAQNIHKQ